MNKKTLVINLLGGPGAGKSTFATVLFSNLKKMGVSCEYVGEFAKDLVWENREETLKDQVYIFGKQYHKIKRVEGKVSFIITDSPLPLSMYYNHILDENNKIDELTFNNFVLSCYNNFDNLNFYLERNFPYDPEGRVQGEEESILVNGQIKSYLTKQNIPYKIIKNDQKSINQIATLLNQLYAIYKNQEKVEMEYERKFLVENFDVSNSTKEYIVNQYYLNIGSTEKRIRKIYNKFYFTEKIGSGDTREEFECEISEKQYKYLLKFKKGKEINKKRYIVNLNGVKSCEINIFDKPIKINMIEVEFVDQEQMKKFTPPKWFGKEVTGIKEFDNYSIANK